MHMRVQVCHTHMSWPNLFTRTSKKFLVRIHFISICAFAYASFIFAMTSPRGSAYGDENGFAMNIPQIPARTNLAIYYEVRSIV